MTRVVTDACIRCRCTDCVDFCPVVSANEPPPTATEQWKAVAGKLAFLER